jgi:hypothetical protein
MELTYHNRPSRNKHNITVTLLYFLHTAFSENKHIQQAVSNQHTHITGLVELTHNSYNRPSQHEYDSLPLESLTIADAPALAAKLSKPRPLKDAQHNVPAGRMSGTNIRMIET